MKKQLFLFLLLNIIFVSAYTQWFIQDERYTLGQYTFKVVSVNRDETQCGINVNGETRWIHEGNAEEFGSLYVQVLDAIAVKTENQDADTCRLIVYTKERDPLKKYVEPVEEPEEEVIIENETLPVQNNSYPLDSDQVQEQNLFQKILNGIKSFFQRILNTT